MSAALALQVPRWPEAPAHIALLVAVGASGAGAFLPVGRGRLLLVTLAAALYAVIGLVAILSVGLVLLGAAALAGYAAAIEWARER